MSYSDTYANSKTKTFEPGSKANDIERFVLANIDLIQRKSQKRYRITIAEVKKQPKPATIKQNNYGNNDERRK